MLASLPRRLRRELLLYERFAGRYAAQMLIAPSPAIARHQAVTRLLQQGDFKSADLLCRQLTGEYPQFLPGWHSASFIALCQGEATSALELINRALTNSPTDARFRLQQARCLDVLKRPQEAVASAVAAESAAANDAVLLDAIGSFYSAAGEHQRALHAYSRALRLDPSRALFWFNRAAVRRFLGQLEKAEEDYDRAISLRPDDYEAYVNRSELRKQSLERNHIRTMEDLLRHGIAPWRGNVQVHYALAKEHEDVGQYAESWAHVEEGARRRREHLQYDVSYDVDTVGWIIDAFPRAPPEPIAGCPSREPIFVVGLPRSGTTLVERILGSHSAVLAAGELNHFAAALVAAAQANNSGKPLPRPQLVAATRDLDFAALGTNYLERTRPGTYRRDRFTDKMPLNFLYCGLIRRALPRARIVHVTRHPMASCYAMFKTLFKDGYPFSYNLSDIARYYLGYRRLMDHWRRSMPGVIYDISYEQLVMDQGTQSRRLLAACELEWEDGCLDFHRNPTATTTASASQVRRPIYDSSLNQWRHYEKQLEGLRSQLASAGLDAAELQ
jgi:tetratricopeptide (TPR) repeat protein